MWFSFTLLYWYFEACLFWLIYGDDLFADCGFSLMLWVCRILIACLLWFDVLVVDFGDFVSIVVTLDVVLVNVVWVCLLIRFENWCWVFVLLVCCLIVVSLYVFCGCYSCCAMLPFALWEFCFVFIGWWLIGVWFFVLIVLLYYLCMKCGFFFVVCY